VRSRGVDRVTARRLEVLIWRGERDNQANLRIEIIGRQSQGSVKRGVEREDLGKKREGLKK